MLPQNCCFSNCMQSQEMCIFNTFSNSDAHRSENRWRGFRDFVKNTELTKSNHSFYYLTRVQSFGGWLLWGWSSFLSAPHAFGLWSQAEHINTMGDSSFIHSLKHLKKVIGLQKAVPSSINRIPVFWPLILLSFWCPANLRTAKQDPVRSTTSAEQGCVWQVRPIAE